jgi:hypothetical protein
MPDETNSSLIMVNRSRSQAIYPVDYVSKDLAMNRPSRLREMSTGVGLLVLALGFSSLGILSLLKRYPENAADGLFAESTYFIGSFLSLLVGVTFLVTAVLFLKTKFRGKTTFSPDGYSKASHGRCKNIQSASPVVIDR